MSEVADELDRMADELEAQEDAQMFGPMFDRGVAEGLRRAHARLRERSAEIRKKFKPANLYKALPKPSQVESRQWWCTMASNALSNHPSRVTEANEHRAILEQSHRCMSALVSDMLTADHWHYLGSDAEPARP